MMSEEGGFFWDQLVPQSSNTQLNLWQLSFKERRINQYQNGQTDNMVLVEYLKIWTINKGIFPAYQSEKQ